MLVKLVVAMQRLKKISKKLFVMINKDGGRQLLNFVGGGDTAVMRGHIAHGGVPPARGNPVDRLSISSYP